jgi:putative endonuclease
MVSFNPTLLGSAHDTGREGERIAREHLQAQGYAILEQNWRKGRAEIDIIAKEDDVLVFVEVKTRSSEDFGRPETFISPRQAELLAAGAAAYMEETGHDWELRFDVISIILDEDGAYQLEHLKDSFFPGMDD